MSYDLCIWDPSRHAPLPASRKEGIAMAERLEALTDVANPAFVDFAILLVRYYDSDAEAKKDHATVSDFWGSEPRKDADACRSAVFRLSIPADECIRQISHAVDAAAVFGLVVMDDEIGMCFLPDGTILPEEDRAMWESDVAEMRAGPADPDAKIADGRTFLERLGGELFDALGRGNRHQ